MHGIGEGVLAVDSASRVSVRNDEAERLLGTPLPAGSPPLSELDVSAQVAPGGRGRPGGGQPAGRCREPRVRALSDGLRAQRHELSNRLYTLSGLLQLGHNGEAVDYVQPLTETSSTLRSAVADAVSDPYLQALLVAKTEQAQE